MANISQAELRTIITDPDGAETLVKRADELGQELARMRLSTNQIRALFGEVRQIQGQWDMGDTQRAVARRHLHLLRPKMAYRAKRERSRAVEQLVAVLDPALQLVLAEKDKTRQTRYFQHFVDFFEAILAYHKAYGGN